MGQKVSYSTFPRVGNSFLRKYLQMITGVATGSDMPMELNLDMQLISNKAEEITDSSVWIYKSHDPYLIPFNQKGKANKVICCVRNPYDIIASLFTFNELSVNQGGKMNEKLDAFPVIWGAAVEISVSNIYKYHEIMLNKIQS